MNEQETPLVRADKGLAFLLQYENVAWYENGSVRILDRRIYPQVHFVKCDYYTQVAQAVHDMVTQSLGPYLAVGMGMALAAYEARDLPESAFHAYLDQASDTLSHARPTTSKRMAVITEACRVAAIRARVNGLDPAEAAAATALRMHNDKYVIGERIADTLVSLLPQKGAVMTQCYAEMTIGFLCKAIAKQNKQIRFFCPETRPFFQGSRLTASVIMDQGMDVTIISDNMPAYCMQNEGIDMFTAGGDAICMDGYLVNKVGTLQIAICANRFHVPFYVAGRPDQQHQSIQDITIEQRDGNEVLYSMGTRIAKEGQKGLYPAFDITPPELISGFATDKGLFAPENLADYYRS